MNLTDDQMRWIAREGIPIGDSPNPVLRELHYQLRHELFDAGADTGTELFMLHPNTQAAIMRVLERVLEVAEELMEGDAYPDRLSDRDLLILSYQLPIPLALALLRKRLIRGVALRDMAREASFRKRDSGDSEYQYVILKSDRQAA